MEKKNNQITGNIGLYYVCYRLSKNGWNALMTSRNAIGVDVVIYSQNAQRSCTVQVKTLTGKDDVPLGNHIENLIAEYLTFCKYDINTDNPEVFIIPMSKVRELMHPRPLKNKEGNSYWLKQKCCENFKANWIAFGNG